MKSTLLPWLLVLAALAGAFLCFNDTRAKQTRSAKLRADTQSLESVRAENEALKQAQVQGDELVRLRKDNETLQKLRAEIPQLRLDKEQLTQQIQAAQVAQAEAQARLATPPPPAQPVAVADPTAPFRTPEQLMADMNTLKQIGLACMMYAADRNGAWPANFDALKGLLPQQFYNGTDLTQFEMIPFSRQSDIRDPATTIIARGKGKDTTGRRALVFGDGHAELRRTN